VTRTTLHRAASFAVTVALCCSAAPAASHSVPGVSVAAIAGTGTSGSTDGPAASANFVTPAAVAAGPHDELYVADAGAQRIRIVSPNRTVRTLAGSAPLEFGGLWAAPGNVDGPGTTARFSEPEGIAVARDGTVYVADTGNKSIRRITPAGVVSTFATGFGAPRGIAIDDAGDLYVADAVLGLRKIASNGTVTSIPVPATRAYGVALLPQPFTIVLSDDHGFLVGPGGTSWYRIASDKTSGPPIQGDRHLGVPYLLAPIGPRAIVYTDPDTGTVRYLNVATFNTAVLEQGGQPLGIATTRTGAIVLSDAASRKIERISGFDARDVVDAAVDALPPRRPGTYRVLEIGNSFVWWNNTRVDSIAQQIARGIGPKADVVPVQMVGSELPAIVSYIEEYGELFDMVILHVDDGTIGNALLERGASAWHDPVLKSLRSLRESLEREHVGLLVVERPMPNMLGPAEGTAHNIRENALAAPNVTQKDAWDAVLRESGAHWTDLWPAYMRDIRSVRVEPIYAGDEHLTPHGRSVTAAAVLQALRPLLPARMR